MPHDLNLHCFSFETVYANGPEVLTNEQVASLTLSPKIKEIFEVNCPEVFIPVKGVDSTPRGWFNLSHEDLEGALLSLKPILMKERFDVSV